MTWVRVKHFDLRVLSVSFVFWGEGGKVIGDLSLYKIGQAPLVFGLDNINVNLCMYLIVYLSICLSTYLASYSKHLYISVSGWARILLELFSYNGPYVPVPSIPWGQNWKKTGAEGLKIFFLDLIKLKLEAYFLNYFHLILGIY